VASCTKLITTIAALQTVEKGLIGLDDSVFKVLPELAELQIISSPDDGKTLSYTKPKKVITLRHLLTHTSGLAYDGLSPLLMAWRAERGQESMGYPTSGTVPECYSTPLLFEPGEGWVYSPSLDWAGYLVCRLNGNTTLEQYFTDNIFKIVGRSAPFPTFNLSKHPEMKAQLVAAGERTPEGRLKAAIAPFGDKPLDEHGGSGLALRVGDYLAVEGDLVSESPKLLRSDTITAMFSPQFLPGSGAEIGLKAFSMIWSPLLGNVIPEGVNHGLGGLLLTKYSEESGIPAFTLAWGGFTNPYVYLEDVFPLCGKSNSTFAESKPA
jgi:CubicO group peptidase (beta-lactamase class C family)